MNAEIMAEWLRRQGRRVQQVAGSYWVELAPRIFQAFPYHRTLALAPRELQTLLRELGAIGVRFSVSTEASEGAISYHVVCANKTYAMEQLSGKARYDVRKGLGAYRVEPVAPSQLAAEGWAVRAETLERQGRIRAESRRWWEQLCLSTEGLPGVECWGARDTGSGLLCGSLIVLTCDDIFCILYQQSRTACMRLGVNNALSYVVTQAALSRPHISEVFYGLHSLDAPGSVDEYKFRMGYSARPVRQRVAFHPWVAPVFNATSHRMLLRLHERYPERPALAKAEGLVRLWLEGRKPLAEQPWPDALALQRSSLLAV